MRISNALVFVKRVTLPAIALLMLGACTPSMRLATVGASEPALAGSYRLFLYGCSYRDEVQNLAVLVPEDSALAFSIFALPTEVKERTGLTGTAALAEARTFLQCNPLLRDTAVGRIVDAKGTTVAYEVRPQYDVIEIGSRDPVWPAYWQRNNAVTVYINVDPLVERKQQGFDDRDSTGSHEGN
ncbi:MAG: hypothetical protein M0042_02555 [Nitrospiraceae bacterium]|nr:hypothetical protein [Nitrospiraceae bacterium]